MPEVFHLPAFARLAAGNKTIVAAGRNILGILGSWSSETKQEMVGGHVLYDGLIHDGACQTDQLFSYTISLRLF